MIAVIQKNCVLTDTRKSSLWVPEGDRRVLGGQPCVPCIGTGKTNKTGEHIVGFMPTTVLSAQGEAVECLFKYYFYHWNVHLSDLDKGWMMLPERNMMQLQLFPKALPFLIHKNICLTSHLPGRPCVLYLLLLIEFFSVCCSEVIKILRLCFPQVCRKNCHCTKAIS